jgi:hypothetical protein
MRTSREDAEKRARIAELLRKGLRPIQIRKRLGCGSDIITWVKRELEAEREKLMQQEHE